MARHRIAITAKAAPVAVGPYSQAIKAGAFVFLAGQIPLDPNTGMLIAGGIDAQTRRVLDNIVAVLDASGSSLSQVVKTTVYLRFMADFAIMNSVYSHYFTTDPPARTTIAVTELGLGALVEIDVTAISNSS